MRLDVMKDGGFGNEVFSMQVKNHKAYFTVNGDRHVFGSKTYPIGKRAEIFMSTTTNEGECKDVADVLENRSNWQPRDGFCYYNAEILHQTMKHLGYDAKYFSGWIFTGAGYPIHHAWVVLNGNVYDISINYSSINLIAKQAEDGRDPYSKECVREVKEMKEKWKPIADNFIWGKVPNEIIYVGAESNLNSAKLQYDKAVTDVNTHPSYRSMNKGNKFFKSRYQKLLDEV